MTATTSAFLFALIGYVVAFTPSNFRMHVITTTFCNKDVKDFRGNPVACGKSTADETYGLTLPGMEDGSITTREDMIVAKDGRVNVRASPNHPYQFVMTVETAGFKRIDQLFKNKAFTIYEGLQEPTFARTFHTADTHGSMAEHGWTYEGIATLDGDTVHKYTENGPQGVDSMSGANYTALYQAGFFPDKWTFYTDSDDDKPVRLLAINSFSGETVQKTDFSNYERLSDDIVLAQAQEMMYGTYQITGLGEDLTTTPPLKLDFLMEHLVGEEERVYFENAQNSEWMKPGRLREGASGAAVGVKYFDIAKGSAADTFFHAVHQRYTANLIKFEYPKKCRDGTGSNKYCLYISVDQAADKLTVKAGMLFVDVTNDWFRARLTLTVEIGMSDGSPVLNLDIFAEGCAVVLQWSFKGVGVTVSLCISGDASGEDLLQPDKQTFAGKIRIEVRFQVTLPKVGSLINWGISGEIGCTAKPNNVISAYGTIRTEEDIVVAGGYVSLEITGNTLDNRHNKWEFHAAVRFFAWVSLPDYEREWSLYHPIWYHSPVEF